MIKIKLAIVLLLSGLPPLLGSGANQIPESYIKNIHEAYEVIYNDLRWLHRFDDEDYLDQVRKKITRLKLNSQLQDAAYELVEYNVEGLGNFCFYRINIQNLIEDVLTIAQEYNIVRKELENKRDRSWKILRPLYDELRELRRKHRNIVENIQLDYNYRVLSALKDIIFFRSNVSVGNAKEYVHKLEEFICEITISSWYGIYTYDERVNLNHQVNIYLEELRAVHNGFGVRSKLLFVLDVNDSVLTPNKAKVFWWKIKFLNDFGEISYDEIRSYIHEIERNFCSKEARLYILKEKQHVVEVIYTAAEDIKFVQNGTSVPSGLLRAFPLYRLYQYGESIENYDYPIGTDAGIIFRDELMSDYNRYCGLQ